MFLFDFSIITCHSNVMIMSFLIIPFNDDNIPRNDVTLKIIVISFHAIPENDKRYSQSNILKMRLISSSLTSSRGSKRISLSPRKLLR